MTNVWLPEDDWQRVLKLPEEMNVTLWRSGMPIPHDVDNVEFYVPEYLGPHEVIDIISSMPNLRVVQTLTAGYDHLLSATPAAVTLCNARGVHEASTAELAVGLAIASLRGFPGFVSAQQEGQWVHARHESLADKRVLLIGVGSVGRAIADRLAPFEVSIRRVGRHARDDVHGVADLPRLLPESDVVFLAVPLSDVTSGLVDQQFLSHMRAGSLLVNVSRGPVVQTDALLAELQTGRLNAALDVTDPEPLPVDHPLWQLPNVLISPHVGGDTSAFLPRAWRLLQQQLDRFAVGEPLLNVVRDSR